MSNYVAAIRTDRPVAYYRLNEASGASAADSSGHSYPGGYAGAITYRAVGALLSDPDPAVSSADTTGVVSLGSQVPVWTSWKISLECWLNMSGAWHHVVVTFDGAVYTYYLDGIPTTGSGGDEIRFSLDFAFIGSVTPGTIMDEAAVYTYVLSPLQVTTHYQLGKNSKVQLADIIDAGFIAGITGIYANVRAYWGPDTQIRHLVPLGTNLVVEDTFACRSSSGSLGKASDGSAYSVLSSSQATVGCDPSVALGYVYRTGSGTGWGTYIVQVGSASSVNAEIMARVVFGTAADALALLLRVVDSNNYVAMRLASGSNGLQLQKMASGTMTTTGLATPLLFDRGVYWIRFRLIRTTYFMRYWLAGSTEPRAWSATGTDGAISTTAGGYGVGFSSFGITQEAAMRIDTLTVAPF